MLCSGPPGLSGDETVAYSHGSRLALTQTRRVALWFLHPLVRRLTACSLRSVWTPTLYFPTSGKASMQTACRRDCSVS